jgi:hypothetical protein
MSKTFFHKRLNNSIIPESLKLYDNDYSNKKADKKYLKDEVSS